MIFLLSFLIASILSLFNSYIIIPLHPYLTSHPPTFSLLTSLFLSLSPFLSIVVSVNSIDGDHIAAILTDGMNTEIQCNVSHLQTSSEVTTGHGHLMG